MIPTTPREVALDAAAILAVSAGICAISHEISAMSLLVAAVWIARTGAWRALARPDRHGLGAELAFCALATLIGGFNDWRTVDGHGVYAYTVPTDLPGVSSIPAWMLAYWGLILRFLATLAMWSRLGPAPAPRDLVRLVAGGATGAWLKVVLELGLVLATRQVIYRAYLDPVWSWLPFLVAGALHFALFGWDARDRWLCALALAAGPLVEALYIQVGGLHYYHLGWLGGVPVWIALWWALAILIWRDLAPRVLALLSRRRPCAL